MMKNKIILNRSISYVGLGDRLDVMGIGKILHEQTGDPIIMHQPRGSFKDFDLILELFNYPCEVNKQLISEIEAIHYFEHNSKGVEQKQLLKAHGYPRLDIDSWGMSMKLPENFITAQFDGNQSRNRLRDPEGIIQEYRDQGYEVIIVGGRATDKRFSPKQGNLKNIAYAMSKAQGHVGVDSGMMNLAKFCMKPEQITVYILESFVSSFVRRLEEMGATLKDIS